MQNEILNYKLINSFQMNMKLIKNLKLKLEKNSAITIEENIFVENLKKITIDITNKKKIKIFEETYYAEIFSTTYMNISNKNYCIAITSKDIAFEKKALATLMRISDNKCIGVFSIEAYENKQLDENLFNFLEKYDFLEYRRRFLKEEIEFKHIKYLNSIQLEKLGFKLTEQLRFSEIIEKYFTKSQNISEEYDEKINEMKNKYRKREDNLYKKIEISKKNEFELKEKIKKLEIEKKKLQMKIEGKEFEELFDKKINESKNTSSNQEILEINDKYIAYFCNKCNDYHECSYNGDKFSITQQSPCSKELGK